MSSIIVRVYGEPQPNPKKDIGQAGKGGRPIIIDNDYRTRKNPVTGRVEKYDRGYKKAWIEKVRSTTLVYMAMRGLSPIPKGVPIAVGYLFFRTRPASNKTEFPAQTPDKDNYEYAITNALKSTPKKRKKGVLVETEYPDGILYYDDCQIVWNLHPSGILWADENNPPGVIIQVELIENIKDQIYKRVEMITGENYSRQIDLAY